MLDDTTAPYVFDGCDIVLLPNACAKHVSEMLGVGTYQSGAVAVRLHRRSSGGGSWLRECHPD